MTLPAFAVLMFVLVALEIYGEVSGRHWLTWIAKPLASTCFVLVGLGSGALDSDYGNVVFVGLLFCMAGDIFLIPKEVKRAFLMGLVSFLLGHVAYAAAFLVLGVSWLQVVIAVAALIIPVIIVSRWLLPNVEPRMQVPVKAYMLVITAMVALSIGTSQPVLIAAAVLFYLSDLFVARQRFVTRATVNRTVGLPLYFLAQLLFAASV